MSTQSARARPALPFSEPLSRLSDRARRRFLNLDDFERHARRILPKMLYAFVAEGAETNASLRANRASFADFALLPRVLQDTSGRSQKTTLLGRVYDHPFGIAPMGATAMCAYRGDIALGRAAGAANIPMIISAASVIRLEEIRAEAPHAWFQAYLPAEPDRIEPMFDRVAEAGFETLVITVDIPVSSNREHYVRGGFNIPVRPTPRVAWQGITRPRWLFGTALRTYLRHGPPHFENMDAYRGPAFLSRAATRQTGRRDALSWNELALMRRRWKGKLIVKGVLAPKDAERAEAEGVDALVLSNHGGRQLDSTVAPMRTLQRVRDCVRLPLIVDGGVRRGTDVLKALGLGADFLLIGRPFLFAAVAGGESAVRHGISLLAEEIGRDMALLGIRSLSEIGGEHVVRVAG